MTQSLQGREGRSFTVQNAIRLLFQKLSAFGRKTKVQIQFQISNFMNFRISNHVLTQKGRKKAYSILLNCWRFRAVQSRNTHFVAACSKRNAGMQRERRGTFPCTVQVENVEKPKKYTLKYIFLHKLSNSLFHSISSRQSTLQNLQC